MKTRIIPSEKKLRDKLYGILWSRTKLPGNALKQLRQVLVAWRNFEIGSRAMLEKVNDIFEEGQGIEHIQPEHIGKPVGGAYYVSWGNTSLPTLLLDIDRDRVWAISPNDWIEAEERAGRRFP